MKVKITYVVDLSNGRQEFANADLAAFVARLHNTRVIVEVVPG